VIGNSRYNAALDKQPFLFCLLAALIGCGSPTPEYMNSPESNPTVTAALGKHAVEILSLPGVTGIAEGICDGKPCVKVFVEKEPTEKARLIPHELDGIPVVLERSGTFRASQPD